MPDHTQPAVLAVLLSDVAPVAMLIALGYVLGRWAVVSEEEARAVNRFALLIAAPPLIFGLMATQPVEAFSPLISLGYLTAEVISYAAGYLIARRFGGRSRRESLLIGMCAAYVNHVFFVLPVAENIYGPAAAGPVLTIITADSVILLTATVILLDVFAKGRASLGSALMAILRMPYVVAIFAGLGWNLASLPLPEGLTTFTNFAGSAASPAALFAAGVVMAKTEAFRLDKLALGVGALKLALHPMLTAFAYLGLGIGLGGVASGSAMLVAAGPAGSFALALALHYRVEPTTIGRIIVYTTAGSVVSLSLLA